MAIRTVVRLLWRKRLLICAAAVCVVAAALGGAALMGKTYVGEALVQLKFGGDAGSSPGAPLVTVDGVAIVESEAEIIRSRALARRVLDRLDALPAPAQGHDAAPPPSPGTGGGIEADRRVLALQTGLTVKNDGKTYLIHVIYAAKGPIRAAQVANAFAEEYLKSRIEVSVAAAQRTSDWLDAQIVQANADKGKVDEEIRAFRARPDVVAADAGNAQVREQQMRDIVGQVSAAAVDSQRLEGRLQRLTEAAAAGRVPSAQDLQGSTDVQRLVDAEVTARQDSSRLAETLGTKHPLYARADKAHAVALQQLTEAVSAAAEITRKDLASARAAQAALAAQLATLRAAALDGQIIDRTLKELEARETTAQGNLDRLREAHRQALALADLKPIAAQMVSRAEPIAIPTSPNMKVIAVLSGLGGIVAGLALVVLLEQRDMGFTTGGQAAGELGIPCGGMIPAVTRGEKPAARRIYHQALKSLVIGAGLAEPKDGCVVIVVTSTMAGEGKSDLVRDLAATLGELDRRVLVVDDTAATVDQPTAQDDAKAPDAEPAGEAPHGRRTDTALTPFHRPSGDLAEILASSDRFKPWIEEAKMQFDVVIVEAPAVLADVEGVMMARSADLVLFAVRWRSTPKQAAIAAFRQLIPAPGQQALVVITEVDMREHRKLGTRDNLYFARRYAGADRPAA